jgi:hypothetical protein
MGGDLARDDQGLGMHLESVDRYNRSKIVVDWTIRGG